MGGEDVENDDDARYDLLANICHDGQVKGGSYSLHIRTRDGKQWYKIQDLIVERILPELIILSESYIQVNIFRSIIYTELFRYGKGMNKGILTLSLIQSITHSHSIHF